MPVSEEWLPLLGTDTGLRASALQNLISSVNCPANLSAAINLKLYFSLDTMLAFDDSVVELVDCSGSAAVAVYKYSAYEINEETAYAENITPEIEAAIKGKALREIESELEKSREETESEAARFQEESERRTEE